MRRFKRYFGNKAFYQMVFAISIPIMLQNSITSMVNMLDNIMIGSLGTEALSGVSIANGFIFVFNMVIFGAGAASGIFTAQYYGAGDVQGVRYTFRMKFIVNMTVTVLAIVVLSIWNDEVLSAFLHSSDSSGDLAKTLELGKEYLVIILVGLIPYALSQVYASTLRETKQVMLPTYAGIIAVVTNFVLNLILIYGLLGFPALGVVGAALATTISRFVELLYLLLCVHQHKERHPFISGAYTSLHIPGSLIRQIIIKGFPFMINELLWSIAITFKNQCISTMGLDAVAAVNIQSSVTNVLSIAYGALANSIAIIVGNMLGAGETEEAKDTDRKLLVFAFLMGVLMGTVQIIIAPFFPQFYNTSDSIRTLSRYMLIISGISMPASALAVSCYYTLRSGGLALLTMLFDCVYACVLTAPAAYVIAYHTSASIHVLFAVVTFVEALKGVLGLTLVNKVTWARTLTASAR